MRGSSEGPVTAGDLLTLEELAHLRRTSTWCGARLVLHAWGVIACAVALHARLLARGLGERMERAGSYAEVLTRATASGA